MIHEEGGTKQTSSHKRNMVHQIDGKEIPSRINLQTSLRRALSQLVSKQNWTVSYTPCVVTKSNSKFTKLLVG